MVTQLAPLEEKNLDEMIFFRKKLISALKDIKELSEANLKKKEEFKIYELENEKLSKTIVHVNAHQEEASRLNGMLTIQQNFREVLCERLQVEVVLLRQDLERQIRNCLNTRSLRRAIRAWMRCLLSKDQLLSRLVFTS